MAGAIQDQECISHTSASGKSELGCSETALGGGMSLLEGGGGVARRLLASTTVPLSGLSRATTGGGAGAGGESERNLAAVETRGERGGRVVVVDETGLVAMNDVVRRN